MRFLFALLLLLASGLAAGADRRFELALDTGTKIRGLNPSQAAAFRAEVAKLTDYLAALPAVAEPPAPVCMRLGSSLEPATTPNRMAAASVGVAIPVGFENGRCHRMTGAGIGMPINQDAGIFFNDYRRRSGGRDYWLLPIHGIEGRVVRFGEKGVLVLREGRLPWRPVRRRAWLERELALALRQAGEAEQSWKTYIETITRLEGRPPKRSPGDDRMVQLMRDRVQHLRDELARKTDVDWVCMGDTDEASPDDDCLDARKPMEPNPGYWDRAHPERIQLLEVHMEPIATMQESKEQYAARLAVWQAISCQRLVELVMP
jgi:hypothetical protein